MRKLAIIPARGGSKRLPRKNIKNFMGRPILSYPIKAAFNSSLFDEVMVSTDDEEIADISKLFGAKIPMFRSEKNSSDHATTIDVIIEVLENYRKKGINFTHACCIYPTAALISPYDLKKAYSKMIKHEYVSVIPVTPFSYPIHRALMINSDGKLNMQKQENIQTRTQDFPQSYHDAGQFYWFDVKKILKEKNLFTSNTGSIILPEHNVQDIDNESDWKMAEMKFKLLNQYHETKNLLAA